MNVAVPKNPKNKPYLEQLGCTSGGLHPIFCLHVDVYKYIYIYTRRINLYIYLCLHACSIHVHSYVGSLASYKNIGLARSLQDLQGPTVP